MATNKNIIMKQFNGTDYDTLYPKTKVEQIENLTPSSIGAVAKSGDTMTGNLTIQNASYPDINLKNTGSGSATKIRNSAHRTQIMSQEDDRNYRVLTLYDKSATTNPLDILQIQQIEGGSQQAVYKVLHTGNLSNLSVAKIATGSYVGTGVEGSANKNSWTFSFPPKVVLIQRDLANNDYNSHSLAIFLTDRIGGVVIGGATNGGGTYGVGCGGSSLTGNTFEWWDTNKGDQMNDSGVTYTIVGIG